MHLQMVTIIIGAILFFTGLIYLLVMNDTRKDRQFVEQVDSDDSDNSDDDTVDPDILRVNLEEMSDSTSSEMSDIY